jgi:hypothetical protein
MKFGRRTYGENGEFAKTQNTLANTTAAAGTSGAEALLIHMFDLTGIDMSAGANTYNPHP